jgi:hypothetical protein
MSEAQVALVRRNQDGTEQKSNEPNNIADEVAVTYPFVSTIHVVACDHLEDANETSD